MTEAKTVPTSQSVEAYIAGVEHKGRREDAARLDGIFRDVTGWAPQMWGPSIIGYGSYDYTYQTGHSGTFLATGFAPRKANMVVYIMPGYADYSSLLARLGKHKMGKSCLYVNKLADVSLPVLQELITAGLRDLDGKWPVTPT